MFFTTQSAQKQLKEPSDNLSLKKAIIFIGENASIDQAMDLTEHLNH